VIEVVPAVAEGRLPASEILAEIRHRRRTTGTFKR